MATHDYVISNASGAAVRADLNNALAAIVTNNSSATAPTTTYAYQWWADTGTSPAVMKLRNAANSAWITLFQLDGEWSTLALENGTAAAPSIYFKDSGTDTGLFSPGADQVAITTGGTERLRIDSNGQIEAVSLGTAAAPTFSFTTDANTGIYSPGADTLAISTNGSQRITVNSSGNVGIATATPDEKLAVNGAIRVTSNATQFSASDGGVIDYNAGNMRIVAARSTAADGAIQFFTTNSSGSIAEKARLDGSGRFLVGTSSYSGEGLLVAQGYAGSTSGEGSCALLRGGTVTAADQALGTVNFGQSANVGATIKAISEGSWTSGSNHRSRLTFSTTADGASSPTERMRITSGGDLLLGSTPPASNGRFTLNVAAAGSNAIAVRNTASTADHWTLFIGTNATTAGWNGAATINYCSRDTGTGRSINAAGTINASGADYAEYMVKAGDFTIAKGDICGVTADGLLTLDYADAVSFVVKSTNPSYVGGDTWGNEDAVGLKPDTDDTEGLAQWEADLEAARQTVDRIAFAGQVPVNVMGATPGQYIVPAEAADGGIEGIAKNEADLTLAEYMRAVGKVIAIEDDGRARIIVKIA